MSFRVFVYVFVGIMVVIAAASWASLSDLQRGFFFGSAWVIVLFVGMGLLDVIANIQSHAQQRRGQRIVARRRDGG